MIKKKANKKMGRTALVVLIGCAAFFSSAAQTMDQKIAALKDSATIVASNKYGKPTFFKRLFLGKNYRTVWATEVKLPVFRMKELGFTVSELGGGQQTKSLRLKDPEGREWALRTIDKDVEGALPTWLRKTPAKAVVQDMISAAHPYAPLTITPLANALDVTVAKAYFFVVPDDPAFGEHRALFANTLCMLEDRNPTPDKTETENTENVVEDLLEKNTLGIAQKEVLRARLLDMLIADWDRHQDQWRWGITQTRNSKEYYAIPRDRDQAYFYSNGLLVKIAQLIALKHMVGFTESTGRIKSLNAKSWNFDKVFLNELTRQDWETITRQFQATLTESIIRKAVQQMPKPVYAINGAELEQKLIERNKTLLDDVLDYYKFLSSDVTVMGSDEKERFHITGNSDSLTLSSYASGTKRLLYKRTFYPAETSRINILGLGGDDEFIVDQGADARIRLTLDGGKGNNVFNIGSNIKHKIYHSDLDAKGYQLVVKEMLKIEQEE
jgi:hypothetical protein